MRLLVILLTFLLFIGIVGFVLTNLDARVEVTVWKTQYEDLPLFLVVILAVFAGIFYAGIIGVAEGAHTRLVNRRLAREARRLERELNYLRTQSATGRRTDAGLLPESATPGPSAATPEPSAAQPEPSVASAPVYGADDELDPDDDVYSGGRAV